MSEAQNITQDEKPKAKRPPRDLSHHLSRATKNRNASSIKRFYKYFSIPNIGQLAGGLPNPSYFPFDTIEAKVALPDRWPPSQDDSSQIESGTRGHDKGKKLASSSSGTSSQITVPHDAATSNTLRRIDVASALQYGTAQGYPPLYNFLRDFTRNYMHPGDPYDGGPDIVLTCGSTDGFAKAMQAFTNEWSDGRDPVEEREGLLVEEFAYMNAIQTAKPRGLNIVPVRVDKYGMCVKGVRGLDDVLTNWKTEQGQKPHLMYTVTVGQNPTGATIPVRRRFQIYNLCRQHDIIIIEDDPYWYLQYPSVMHKLRGFVKERAPLAERPSSGFPFLDSLTPSYLSIDRDGRVVRLDTFSKMIAPGCRLGWITAQPALVERILRITETSTQQPSGFVQSLVSELLLGPKGKADDGKAGADGGSVENSKSSKDVEKHASRGGGADGQGWDFTGWVRWLEGLRGNYERRMNRACDILERGQKVVLSPPDDDVSAPSKDETSNHQTDTDPVLTRRCGVTTTTAQAKEEEKEEEQEEQEEQDQDHSLSSWTSLETVTAFTFDRPAGGMFVWMRFDFKTHPLWSQLADTFRVRHMRFHKRILAHALWVFWTRAPYRVLVAPGEIFSTTEAVRISHGGWSSMRMCFAAVPDEQLAAVVHRLVDGVRDFWQIRDVRRIKSLLIPDGQPSTERVRKYDEDDGLVESVRFWRERQAPEMANQLIQEMVDMAGMCYMMG